MTELTEHEKWQALERTNLSEHDPFCNYGRTNGREMCTCDVLVNIIEGTSDASTNKTVYVEPPHPPSTQHPRANGGNRSDARKRRLEARRDANRAQRNTRARKPRASGGTSRTDAGQ